MSSVDDRIVNMQFNNKQFEAGATQSMKTLTDLEKTVSNTANSKGLSNLGSSVDGVASRFSALQVAGVAALATIVAKATSAGLDLAKSLTIDPLTAGFGEYELNLKSTQTILANTGAKVRDVSKYLQELNRYSDKTIYSFSQMAENIGRFTAAGVELAPATDAIKGMANTAALAGASTLQLNSAMYQMSQALSTGVIKLMDWNSLNNANMGTKNVREALMATTRTFGDHGVAMDAAIKKYGNFRESLTDGWLTTEVFTKTMKVMAGTTLRAGDLTGKTAKELEKLGWEGKKAGDTIAFTVDELEKMGYSTKAAKELNKLSAAAIDSATKIKTFTQLIDVVKESIGSGFATTFKRLFGNLEHAGNLWTTVGEKINGAVGSMFMAVNQVLRGWKRLGGYTAMWNGFGNIFKTLGNLIRPFVEAFKALMPETSAAGKGLADASKGFESFTAKMEKFSRGASALTPILIAMAGGVKYAFDMIGKAVDIIKDAIGPVDNLKAALSDLSMSDVNLANIVKMGGDFGAKLSEIGHNIVAGISEGLSGDAVGRLKESVIRLGTAVIDTFKDVLGIHSPAEAMVPLGENIVQGIVEGIKSGVKFLGQAMMELGKFVAGTLGQLFGNMDAIDFGALFNMIFSGALILTARNFIKTLEGSIGGLTDTLDQMQSTLKAQAIKAIAIAVALLAGSILLLSFIDPKKIGIGIGAIGLLMTELVVAMKMMSGIGKTTNAAGEEISAGSAQMMAMASAMLIMANAVLVLSTAVVIIGNMDQDKVAQGLVGIGLAMAMMVAATYTFSRMEPLVAGAAAGILAMSFAMVVLSGAILAFGKMDPKALEQGLLAIAYALTIMVLAMYGLSVAGDRAAESAAAILIVAVAMNILAGAIALIGNMDGKTLAKGLVVIAVGLLAIVVALGFVSGMGPAAVEAAASIALVAVSLLIMAKAISILAGIPWAAAATGLAILAAALVILLAAAVGAQYVAAGLLILGVSIALIGAAMFLAGAGMLMFAAGLSLIAAAGVAAGLVLAAAFRIFLALLPELATQLAASLVAFLQAIATAMPKIREAFGTIIASLIGVVQDAIPKFGDLFMTLMDTIIKIIVHAIPKYGKVLTTLITTGLKIIRKLVPEYIKTGLAIILAIMDGIEDGIPKIAAKATAIILALLNAIADNYPKLVDGAAKAIIKFVNGLATAIDENASDLRNAGLNLATSIIDGLTGGLLGEGMQAVRDAATAIADALPGWMRKVLHINSPSKVTHEIGVFVAAGLAQGMDDSHAMVAASAKSLGETAAHSMIDPIRSQVSSAVDAVTGLLNASIEIQSGNTNIPFFTQLEQRVIGLANFEQHLADIRNRRAERESKLTDKENHILDKKKREAEKAQAKVDKAKEHAKKVAKDDEKRLHMLMDAAREQQKHADKLRDAAREQKEVAKEQQKASKAAEKAANAQQRAADVRRKKADQITAQREAAEAWASMSDYDRLIKANETLGQAQGALSGAEFRLGGLRGSIQDIRARPGKLTDKERENVRRLQGQVKGVKNSIDSLKDAVSIAQAQAIALFNTFIAGEKKLLDTRITSIRDAQKAYREDIRWQDEFDAADDTRKAEMLSEKAKKAEESAAAKEKEADEKILAAQKLMDEAAAKGPSQAAAAKALIEQANAIVDQAGTLADEAMSASDKARDYRNQAKDILTKDATDAGSSSNSGPQLASRSMLDEAAKSFDRYTASLEQAQLAAATAQSIVQFNQTNTSPEALSAADIYRMSKNLLSAAEIKMGALS